MVPDLAILRWPLAMIATASIAVVVGRYCSSRVQVIAPIGEDGMLPIERVEIGAQGAETKRQHD